MRSGRMTMKGATLATVSGLSVGQVAVLQAKEPAGRVTSVSAQRSRAGIPDLGARLRGVVARMAALL